MNHQRSAYLRAVLDAYLALPDTPRRPRPFDRSVAALLYDRRVPLATVIHALTLASARRAFRDSQAPPLQPIRSLAYFLPLVDELLAHPLPNGYIEYLTAKLHRSATSPKNRVSS